MNLEEEWENFQNEDIDKQQNIPNNEDKKNTLREKIPKCSPIYISTKTKIVYLNNSIDLFNIFWKLPVIDYTKQITGITKKSIKINCINKDQVAELEEKIDKQENIQVTTISKIDNPNGRKVKFKDVRKITIGISKKDIISYKKKEKGAFYNCFAIILRILNNNKFKEIHIKIFNTGKLEIPGIRDDEVLYKGLDLLVNILEPIVQKKITYIPNTIQNVLINSNFTCNFYINRDELHHILKYNYNLHAIYDPCSYPGIQSKFYYNKTKKIQNGVCNCKEKCCKKIEKKDKCREISFMIFRTGSILIVGHCDEYILNIIYDFLKKLLIHEYLNIADIGDNKVKKNKTEKKIRKKFIYLKNQ